MAKRLKIDRWVLSPHAVERMEQRDISLRELAELIAQPDEIIPQGPKWILAKSFPDRSDNFVAAVLLERQEKNLWLVVTVMVRLERNK